ncbi:hypothetical protein C2138_01780 [Salinibacterium hongtaonis]|nr:hypothetical protein C2138_01780 [Salinibacterium hongtaonis]
MAWLVTQPAQLSDSELELIKLAAEEPETWHVDARAADTLRVMQRFERLMGQVGPSPARARSPKFLSKPRGLPAACRCRALEQPENRRD